MRLYHPSVAATLGEGSPGTKGTNTCGTRSCMESSTRLVVADDCGEESASNRRDTLREADLTDLRENPDDGVGANALLAVRLAGVATWL